MVGEQEDHKFLEENSDHVESDDADQRFDDSLVFVGDS
jgi:hypothetical protein